MLLELESVFVCSDQGNLTVKQRFRQMLDRPALDRIAEDDVDLCLGNFCRPLIARLSFLERLQYLEQPVQRGLFVVELDFHHSASLGSRLGDLRDPGFLRLGELFRGLEYRHALIVPLDKIGHVRESHGLVFVDDVIHRDVEPRRNGLF